MINKSKLPEYSIFGYKILNSLHSIFCAYILLFTEFFLTPYFGVNSVQYLAGLFFIFIVNISIIILVINSLIRINKVDIILIILNIPLCIYLPFSIAKIFIVISNFIYLYA